VGIEPDVVVPMDTGFYLVDPSKGDSQYDQVSENIGYAQKMLNAMGYDCGRSDGYFSNQTVQAVKNFQVDVGLAPTGVIDAATANQLNVRYYEYLSEPQEDPQLVAALDVARQQN
jgi:carboxyl-terminal processing protease